MSLRRTACSACARAKRRCDSALPTCSRCASRSMDCIYPHSIVTQHETAPIAQEEQILDDRLPHTTLALVNNGTSDVPVTLDIDMSTMDWNSTNQIAFDDSVVSSHSTVHSVAQEQPPNHTNAVLSGSITTPRTTSLHGPKPQRPKRKDGLLPHRSECTLTTPSFNLPPPWLRGEETETWNFCARQFFFCVETFSRGASNAFIVRMDPATEGISAGTADGSMALQRALGVCAAHETLAKLNRPVFEQYLDMEVLQLIKTSSYTSRAAFPLTLDRESAEFCCFLTTCSEDLSRLQAMVLYAIMRLFSPSPHQRHLGESLEPILASWARELLIKTQMLETCQKQSPQHYDSSTLDVINNNFHDGVLANQGEDFSASFSTIPEHYEATERGELLDNVIESAYRTVLMSYLVRAVYSALTYKNHRLIAELAALPVFITELSSPKWSQSGLNTEYFNLLSARNRSLKSGRRTTYGALGDVWSTAQKVPVATYDQFMVLLLVACKGLDILPSRCLYI